MIDGILFVMLVINFAITITLYIRYASMKRERAEYDVRDEINEVISKFNKGADINIGILEDRIKKAEDIVKRQELLASQGIENKTNILDDKYNQQIKRPLKPKGDVEFGMRLLRDVKRAKGLYGLDMREGGGEEEKKVGMKSHIEKAYLTNHKPLEREAGLKGGLDGLKDGSEQILVEPKNLGKSREYKNRQAQDSVSYAGDYSNGSNAKKANMIAKCIGEGKTHNEIAKELGLSLGEIQLFTKLIRQKILG